MYIQHQHHLAGPGRVNIDAAGLPVFVTTARQFEYRAVEIMADRGLGAWAGPSGVGGVALGVKVGRPSVLSTVTRAFRGHSSSVSRGAVRATGRGSIAAGGNIERVALGKNSRVSNVEEKILPPIGIHLNVPLLTTFRVKGASAVTVRSAGQEVVVDEDTLRDVFAVGVAGGILVVSR